MMVRAARSFTPGPYFWNQKVNRSETQYKWTRNCALIFSYRSPVTRAAAILLLEFPVSGQVSPTHSSLRVGNFGALGRAWSRICAASA